MPARKACTAVSRRKARAVAGREAQSLQTPGNTCIDIRGAPGIDIAAVMSHPRGPRGIDLAGVRLPPATSAGGCLGARAVHGMYAQLSRSHPLSLNPPVQDGLGAFVPICPEMRFVISACCPRPTARLPASAPMKTIWDDASVTQRCRFVITQPRMLPHPTLEACVGGGQWRRHRSSPRGPSQA